jgi:hypothetical protein
VTGIPENPGIIPRAVSTLFEIADKNRANVRVTIETYMVELYNDVLVDLYGDRKFAHGEGPAKLEISKDAKVRNTAPPGLHLSRRLPSRSGAVSAVVFVSLSLLLSPSPPQGMVYTHLWSLCRCRRRRHRAWCTLICCRCVAVAAVATGHGVHQERDCEGCDDVGGVDEALRRRKL